MAAILCFSQHSLTWDSGLRAAEQSSSYLRHLYVENVLKILLNKISSETVPVDEC